MRKPARLAPVAITTMARQLIDLSGKPIDIVFTGLRPGEKVHEQLFSTGETDQRPHHPLIAHAYVPPFAQADAARLTPYGDPEDIRRLLVEGTRSMARDLMPDGRHDSASRLG